MKAIDRIFEYIDYKGVNKSELERKVGISNGYLAKQRQRKADIGEGIMNSVLDNCPDIDPTWLLTGEGNMLKSPIAKIQKVEEGVVGGIPLIPIDAVAGWNGIDECGVLLVNCVRYIIPDFAAAGAEYIIRVSGSSMYPKYCNGDLLACKKIEQVTFFRWGEVYVVDSFQGMMVKRLLPCDENKDAVICKSENEKNPPFELMKSDIRSLSMIVGLLRLE